MPTLDQIRARLAGGLPDAPAHDLDDENEDEGSEEPRKPPPVWASWERRGKCRLNKERTDALIEFGKFSGRLVSEMIADSEARGFLQWLVSQYNDEKKWPPKPLVEICKKHLDAHKKPPPPKPRR